MKKTLALLLAALLLIGIAPAFAETADPYAITEPITIEWWHSHEEQYSGLLDGMLEQFAKENPLITVTPIYQGSYSDIHTKLMSAVTAENVPALCVANTSYPAMYGAQGICTDLTPYMQASGYDVMDFGEGLVASTSYQGQQICLPYLISTQVMYYNKTAADAEGIEMPKTFDDMEEFLKKATIFNEDGTTKRYGTVFGGWDYWYYEMLYKNNGVQVINEEENKSDLNSELAAQITAKIAEWCDKGYAYYAYGTVASSNMRQLFADEGTFSVFHTSSLYDTYVNTLVKGKFEVGMAWCPGGNDGETFKSEVGGCVLLIPEKASQAQKNAAWKLLQFMTSPEINLYWADQTGYFPTRQSVQGTEDYQEYLTRKPAMESVVSMASWINPRNQHPAYDQIANLWRHALAKVFNEKAPVQDTLDELVTEVNEILEDQ